ncbi:MAG: alkaline phosphatase family protein, partial [Ignavibacteria bacterium]
MRKINKAIILLTLISFTLSFAKGEKKENVKLVLQLTVDQLRGDVIDKYKSSFTEDGFYYLLNNGANFTNAHYIHSMTKTAPGHSTLSTGSTPSKHGIVNNDWFEKKDDVQVYSCEDHNSEILGEADKLGRSPKRLMSPTLSDKIAEHNEKSKVFGISVKDRGAILMAGHKGKAFWYSKNSGGFVTSKYYYSGYPDWVQSFNQQKLVDTYYEKGWDLIYTRDKYQFADKDKNNYEKTLPELGYTFPHKFIKMRKKKFYADLPYSPWGDRLTYEFAKALIKNEKLGKDDVVDYLSISFSCTDYIGHLFGPNTLEYEDQILNLDKT